VNEVLSHDHDLGGTLSRDDELIYPPIQEFWDQAVKGTA